MSYQRLAKSVEQFQQGWVLLLRPPITQNDAELYGLYTQYYPLWLCRFKPKKKPWSDVHPLKKRSPFRCSWHWRNIRQWQVAQKGVRTLQLRQKYTIQSWLSSTSSKRSNQIHQWHKSDAKSVASTINRHITTEGPNHSPKLNPLASPTGPSLASQQPYGHLNCAQPGLGRIAPIPGSSFRTQTQNLTSESYVFVES